MAEDKDEPGNENEIFLFLHCAQCLDNGYKGIYDVGWTIKGLQIWCTVCNSNVVNIDFEGQTHPANTSREEKPKLKLAEAPSEEKA